jgi:hypothetical protein
MPRSSQCRSIQGPRFILGVLLFIMLDTAGPTRLQSAEGIPSVRFQILEDFERVAVLDRHTELIWEGTAS